MSHYQEYLMVQSSEEPWTLRCYPQGDVSMTQEWIDWATQRVNRIHIYSPTCPCITCMKERALSNQAQDYANSAQAQNDYVSPREMTREDLGLPLQYDGRWTDFTLAQYELWIWASTSTECGPAVPYAFWLGARGANDAQQ